MTLLLDDIDVIATSGDPSTVEVTGIEHDSRKVVPGTVFCCVPGATTDGVQFAAEAVARGAVGIVCERPIPTALPADVVQVRVAPGQARAAMAQLAAAYWGHPGRDLTMVGVTGTNGKTTVTHLLGAVAAYAGLPAAVLGTLSGVRTTPEATELQRTLASVRDAAPTGARAVVSMEVSSHALVQHRVDAIVYDVAVFTNLSHDHLDFHGTMEQYFEAKSLLFEPTRARGAIIDVDDAWGARLYGSLRIPAIAVRADDAKEVRPALGRTTFRWRGLEVSLAMTGRVNVTNALLAAEAAVGLGIDPAQVAAGLSAARPVPGRLELVAPSTAVSPAVLVDYAHTPAALELVLGEARRLLWGPDAKVVVVFGCGGTRDQGKRPVMGEVASKGADIVVLTSDNPRREDPQRVIEQILAGAQPAKGARGGTQVVVEADRARAIELAIRAAGPGDVVLIAGKGHETSQELADGMVPFDDRAAAAAALGLPEWPGSPDRQAG